MKSLVIISLLFILSCGDDEDDCEEYDYYIGSEHVTCCRYDDGDVVCW